MTPETRRSVFRYGVAIDLVILATGFGLLAPSSPTLLVSVFVGAVALAAWKTGWQGTITTIVLSLISLAYFFTPAVTASHFIGFAFASLAAAGIIRSAQTTRVERFVPASPAAHEPLANVVAFDRLTVEDVEELEKSARERQMVARMLERTAEQQLEARRREVHEREQRQREDAIAREQREREEGEARERREREEAEQREREAGVAQRLAEEARQRAEEAERQGAEEAERHSEAERHRIEEEARQREEAEAQRLIEEERLRVEEEAEQRIEAERRAAEEEERLRAEAVAQRLIEEERRRAEEERQRIEAEARKRAEAAAQKQLDKERRRSEKETKQRIEAERRAAKEEARQRAKAEAQRVIEEERRRIEEEAKQRIEAERRAAEEEARQHAEAEAQRLIEEERRRLEEETQARIEAERFAAEQEAQRFIEAERKRVEEEARLTIESERKAAEEAALKLAEEERRASQQEAQRTIEEERRASHEEAQRLIEEERSHTEEEVRRRAEEERRAVEAEAQRRIEEERRRLEDEARRHLETEREAMRQQIEQQLAAERQALEKEAAEQLAAARRDFADDTARRIARSKPAGPGLVERVTGWFRRPAAKSVNLTTKKISGNDTASRRTSTAAQSSAVRKPASTVTRKPRLLMLERRRGAADTVVPKLKQKAIEVVVVERMVDAVDELFRLRPDAILIDNELPDLEKICRTVSEQKPNLPIIITGRAVSEFKPPHGLRYASFLVRPYDPGELIDLATQALSKPETLRDQQAKPRNGAKPAPVPVAKAAPSPANGERMAAAAQSLPASSTAIVPMPPKPRPEPIVVKSVTDEAYEVICFNCRVGFDALDSDWCSCLTKERTLVCTNCLTCFCKAQPAYKEKFWVEAPPRLFERKTSDARRQQGELLENIALEEAPRPLVLCVEDDEEIQAIVSRVCHNLGYGFVYATNGQDGLILARHYQPNLILSDAFMPKLDGREMCRQLKEEQMDAKMVIMTGLYTDTKYRSEAIKRFHVDDYVAKPVAITELINLLQKHLEGVVGAPVQDDLHELHRAAIEDDGDHEHDQDRDYDDHDHDGIALADLLDDEGRQDSTGEPLTLELAPKPAPKPRTNTYDVCCFNCQNTFDAARADWCSCVGRDQTLLCEHCTGCFCKAPAAYKERFWMDAPPSLFERKMIGSKRSLGSRNNPLPDEVKRPLILLVEDDENVQLIVRTVVTSMGFGFIAGANGQEGLSLAREYNPDLILSDAFMPKLDGREMCRLLKEDPITARAKAIIMTGLYTDRKYRNEALDYFKVDDYVAKPLAVDDLIKLFKKHLPQEVGATM